MKRPEKEFLRRFLRNHPELKRLVGGDPVRVLTGRGWRRVHGVHPLRDRLVLTLSWGERFELAVRTSLRRRRKDSLDGFLEEFRSWFPRWRLGRVRGGTDRGRHQAAALVRLRVDTEKGPACGLLVHREVPPVGPARILTALALWWAQSSRRSEVRSLLLWIPESTGTRLLSLLPLLKAPVTAFEYETEAEGKPRRDRRPRRIFPAATVATQVSAPYVIHPFQEELPALLKRLHAEHPETELLFRRSRWELSYLGLPVAWWDEETGACRFDFWRPRRLESLDQPDFLEHLVGVREVRCFPPPNPRHPAYNYGRELWLQSLVLRARGVILPNCPGPHYCQVPTRLDRDRRVLDLLSRDADGRLLVIELKTEQDLCLFFQGLDYWERVRRHQLRGDFERSGYFRGVPLSASPPVLWLIAPLFELHRCLPTLRESVLSAVEVHCVGLNSDWRAGLKVLRRFRL